MKKLLTALLLLTSTNIIHAEEGIIPKLIEYDVEVIIFEDAHARYIKSEYWNQDAEVATATSEATADTKKTDKSSVKKVNKAIFKSNKPTILKEEYKRINASSEYNVLFYGSWRQTGLEEKRAFDLDLKKLKNRHKVSSENSITGNFKLVLARYLHLYSKMEYQRITAVSLTTEEIALITEGDEQSNETIDKSESYQINDHRRMRSKELHYIDHPLIGMLVQINPVKVSKEETLNTSAAL